MPIVIAHASGSPYAWTLNPLQIVPLLLAAALYGRRVRTLAGRGRPVHAGRVAAFYGGLLLVAVALVSPIDSIGEERLFLVHMGQHLLLGDLGPLLIVAGLTGPILRPVLALPVIGRLRALSHPLLALPTWAVLLYLWHVPALYDGALDHDAVHALEHASFFTAGALIWAALLEPLPGPLWFGTGAKALYVLAVRMVEALLGNIFFWASSAFYPHYAEAPRLWGITPVEDQSYGGALMMTEGSIVTFLTLAWLFYRMAGESEVGQRLVERGLDPERVAHAVRYGYGRALTERLDESEAATAAADAARQAAEHELPATR